MSIEDLLHRYLAARCFLYASMSVFFKNAANGIAEWEEESSALLSVASATNAKISLHHCRHRDPTALCVALGAAIPPVRRHSR